MEYTFDQEIYLRGIDELVGPTSRIDTNYFLYRNKLSGAYGYNVTFKEFGSNAIESEVAMRTGYFRKPVAFDVCGTGEALCELREKGMIKKGVAFSLYDPRSLREKLDHNRRHIKLVETNVLRGIPEKVGKADVILMRPGSGIESDTYENGILTIFMSIILDSLRYGGVMFAQLPNTHGYRENDRIASLNEYFGSIRTNYDVDFIPKGWKRVIPGEMDEVYPIAKIRRKQR